MVERVPQVLNSCASHPPNTFLKDTVLAVGQNRLGVSWGTDATDLAKTKQPPFKRHLLVI